MITTGSKFFYALAALLLVGGVLYGYTTGGGSVGPLSLGYKGGVGDVVGYGILVGAAAISLFLGLMINAFRDADPHATAELIGTEAPPAPAIPGTSYWPIVGAFGAGLTAIGVVLDSVFFVLGLVVLAAAAIEWTIQAWSERATGDPTVNREIRNRIMLPLEVPIAGALVVAVVILGYSRVFLAVSADNAVWVALAVSAVIFVVGTALASRPHVRSDLIAGLLVVGALVTIGLGISAAVTGEREFEEHHEDELHAEEEGTTAEPLEEHVEQEGAIAQESN
jgi:hypothetical protein